VWLFGFSGKDVYKVIIETKKLSAF